MGFGINKKFFSFLLNPYILYQYYKRSKFLKKYKDQNLSLGMGVSIQNVVFGNYVHLGNTVSIVESTIGNHSYVNSNTKILRSNIGKFCSIGPNVQLGMGIHPTDLISTHPAFYSNNKAFKTFADKTYYKEYGSIRIGNDVWIGSNVIIMDNLTIADGAIVAAGAIVTKDVKPYEIVGGIPAKHIKYRIDKENIPIIINVKWWNKDEEWFKKNYKLFLSKADFFEYFDNN